MGHKVTALLATVFICVNDFNLTIRAVKVKCNITNTVFGSTQPRLYCFELNLL